VKCWRPSGRCSCSRLRIWPKRSLSGLKPQRQRQNQDICAGLLLDSADRQKRLPVERSYEGLRETFVKQLTECRAQERKFCSSYRRTSGAHRVCICRRGVLKPTPQYRPYPHGGFWCDFRRINAAPNRARHTMGTANSSSRDAARLCRSVNLLDRLNRQVRVASAASGWTALARWLSLSYGKTITMVKSPGSSL
jgi:hypothetical protein